MEWPDEESLYAGVTLGLSQEQLAPEVARQLLAVLKGERESTPLVEAARLGRAVGLSVAEMERVSGYTRQTIYNALRLAEDGMTQALALDRSMLSRHVLVALASMPGEVPAPELARRLALGVDDVARALQTLAAEGLCDLRWRDPAQGFESLSASATREGSRMLHGIFDDLFLRRPDGFAVYLRIDPAEASEIIAGAASIVSSHEHTVMDASVAPSFMSTPELALTIRAPTSRVAVNIAADIWNEIREARALEAQVAAIVDVIPPSTLPCGDSPVLDAFTEAIVVECVDVADDVRRERLRYRGGGDERSLACRCLTSAARALRRSLHQERDPRPIVDADTAFGELLPVGGLLALDRDTTPIQRLVKDALELGAERLGPYRGGELASFRATGGPPNVVERIQPSAHDLEQMVRLAGKAVGKAARLGCINAALELREVVTPVG